MTSYVRSALWRAIAASLLVAGCAQNPAVPTDAASGVPSIFDAQRAVSEYIDSGRYAADVAAVVSQARAWMEQRAPAVARPAIVLDVDETSLSNWRAYRANGWSRVLRGDCDLEAGPCNIRAWQDMAQAEALPPTREMVDRARQLGVAVFFITGRGGDHRAATEKNLLDQGYTFDRLILRPPGVFLSAAAFKAPERCALEKEGYRILLSMGDQQSDLMGGCAERTFKLPNPVYYLP